MTDTTTNWRATMRAKFEARKAAMSDATPPVRRVGDRAIIHDRDEMAAAFLPPRPAPTKIEVRVVGLPKGQPRVNGRIVEPKGRKKFIHFYTPKDADDWKAAIGRAIRPHLTGTPMDGPVRCCLTVLLPRPQYLSTRWYQMNAPGELRATCKPDVDNLMKSALDQLTVSGLWKDDAQVCDGPVQKFYHAIGDEPGARLTVEVLPPVPTPPKRMKAAVQAETLF